MTPTMPASVLGVLVALAVFGALFVFVCVFRGDKP